MLPDSGTPRHIKNLFRGSGLGVIVPLLAGRSGVIRANGYLQAAAWGGFTVGPLLAGGLTAAGLARCPWAWP